MKLGKEWPRAVILNGENLTTSGVVLENCGSSGVGEEVLTNTGQAETRHVTHPDLCRATSHSGDTPALHSSSRSLTFIYTKSPIFLSIYPKYLLLSFNIYSIFQNCNHHVNQYTIIFWPAYHHYRKSLNWEQHNIESPMSYLYIISTSTGLLRISL